MQHMKFQKCIHLTTGPQLLYLKLCLVDLLEHPIPGRHGTLLSRYSTPEIRDGIV